MKVGILGGGQLGRMLALAGLPLGLRFVVLDPAANAPVGQLAKHVLADYDDDAALAELARSDVCTYEFESVPEAAARAIQSTTPVHPTPEALRIAQDRLNEKLCFRELGIPTPAFEAVDSEHELRAAIAKMGLPAVLKTRRHGYDGKGQFLLRETGDIASAWLELGGVPLILEGFVRFERELSVLSVRGLDGATAFYPLVENHHEQGMLRFSRTPVPALAPEQQKRAESYAVRLLDHMGYVGVLALELFEAGGQLLANEMAPRVHNSGHLTIEGARTSQFENHLRAILGLPLGDTSVPEPVAMLNLVGGLPRREDMLAVPDAHLHFYAKQPRPGRKVGHVTVRAPDAATLDERVARLEAIIASD